MPWVKAWNEKYGKRGLVIVGIHTPKPRPSASWQNVKRHVAELGIRHAIAQDNDFATWRAYGVQAWPTVFFIDKQGRVRQQFEGELTGGPGSGTFRSSPHSADAGRMRQRPTGQVNLFGGRGVNPRYTESPSDEGRSSWRIGPHPCARPVVLGTDPVSPRLNGTERPSARRTEVREAIAVIRDGGSRLGWPHE